MTKAIINGKVYNTETATHIGRIGSDSGYLASDFRCWTAELYKTRKGAFFMHGDGGPRSPFAVSHGQGGWSGSEGVRELTPDTALRYAEASLSGEVILQHFAKHLDEA